jgi:S-adenosylmethionine synthetase
VAASPEAARALNVVATQTLAKATSARSILLIYISTDYVFRGTQGEAPYAASAKTDPTNFYGETKRDGEVTVMEIAGAKGLGVVFRVPLLYGPAETPSESAVNCLVDFVKRTEKGEKVMVDDWAVRYPTCTEDVAVVLKDVVKKWEERGKGQWKGGNILQFSAEEPMTKYQMCKLFAELLGAPDKTLQPAAGGGSLSPYDAHLSTKELEAEGINAGAQSFKGWW